MPYFLMDCVGLLFILVLLYVGLVFAYRLFRFFFKPAPGPKAPPEYRYKSTNLDEYLDGTSLNPPHGFLYFDQRPEDRDRQDEEQQ